MRDRLKTALVTGAARGIGAAIVARLLADGYEVIAADLPHSIRGDAEMGRRDVNVDICDSKMIALLAEEVPHLDLLVNNAGVFARTPLDDNDTGEAVIFAVNAAAPARLVTTFLPALEHSPDPAVVSIASVRGLTASERAAAYSISKAMVIDLTTALAARFNGRIRCNAVAPGDIATGMTPPESDILASLLKRIPLGRLGRPEEVANAVAFLASPRARAINGTVLPVDGGFLCS